MNNENVMPITRRVPNYTKLKLSFASNALTPIRNMEYQIIPKKDPERSLHTKRTINDKRITKNRNGKTNQSLRAKVKKEFILDGWKPKEQKLPEYNGLNDRNLLDFFNRPKMKKHLVSMKIVNFLINNR